MVSDVSLHEDVDDVVAAALSTCTCRHCGLVLSQQEKYSCPVDGAPYVTCRCGATYGQLYSPTSRCPTKDCGMIIGYHIPYNGIRRMS